MHFFNFLIMYYHLIITYLYTFIHIILIFIYLYFKIIKQFLIVYIIHFNYVNVHIIMININYFNNHNYVHFIFCLYLYKNQYIQLYYHII